MNGVNQQRTRVYDSPPILEPKTLLWKTSKLFVSYKSYPAIVTFQGLPGNPSTAVSMPSGHGFTDPVIASDTLYFSLYINDGYVYALDSTTGKDKWRFKLKGLLLSAPAVSGDAVYTGASDGTFYALSAATGEELWKLAQKGRSFFTVAPVVADSTVYFSSTEAAINWNARPYGRVFALDARTGRELWVFKTNGTLSAPAYADKTLFVGGSEGYLHALDSATGQERWKLKAGGGGVGQPSVKDGVVYFHTGDGSLYAVAVQTGEAKWKNTKGPKAATMLALYDGNIFYGGGEHNLYAADAATGQPKWEYKTSKPCRPPVVAGSVVYFPSYDGVMYAVDAATGLEKWKLKSQDTVSSAPVIAAGVIYFLNSDGHMYALK